jgi:hypothetical protein
MARSCLASSAYALECSHRDVFEYVHELRVMVRASAREQTFEWWHVDDGEASILSVVARERNSPELHKRLQIGP